MPERALRWNEAPCEPYAIVALGTNLPFQDLEGPGLLSAALQALAASGLKPVRQSSFWISPSWPNEQDPMYVNAVAVCHAGGFDPAQALALLLEVEARFGRERRALWAPRTLDLDLIDFDGLVLTGDDAGPSLPHPRCRTRGFVLAPLAEIAPGWRHPVTGESVAALLSELPADGRLQPITPMREERV